MQGRKFDTKNKLTKLILSMIILEILIITLYKAGNSLMGELIHIIRGWM